MAFTRPYPRFCSTLRGLRATKLRQKELRRLARDGEIDPPMTAELSRRLDDFDDEIKMERDGKIETARIRRSDRKRRTVETRAWLETFTPDKTESVKFWEGVLDTETRTAFAPLFLLAGAAVCADPSDDTDWGDDITPRTTVTQDAESAYA